MNRNSDRAQELAEITGASPRQLERWSALGLIDGPEPGATPEEQIALTDAVLAIGAQGREPDRVALITAGRFGLACKLLAPAFRRRLELDDPLSLALMASVETDDSGEPTDEGSSELERRAADIEELPVTGPDASLLTNLQSTLADTAKKYDETPAALWHSAITLVVTLASGAPGYFTPAIPALLGLVVTEPDRAVIKTDADLASLPVGNLRTLVSAALDSPREIARTAKELRPLGAMLGRGSDADASDESAALLACLGRALDITDTLTAVAVMIRSAALTLPQAKAQPQRRPPSGRSRVGVPDMP